MTHPLLAGFGPDDALLVDPAGPVVTAARFCGAAARLAKALPPLRHAINCCEDPARFLLGSAAALAAGHTLVFPPLRGDDALRTLQQRFPDAYALVDAPPREAALPCVIPDAAQLAGEPSWPPPLIADAHPAATLFTSGSTGEPAAQLKTWSALVRGTRTFARAFGPIPRDAVVVGTVAPQHMFGCETILLAPWQTGTAVALARPLFPADLARVVDALAALGRRIWLMTTPLHLRAFHEGLAVAPQLDRVIVSTMPLAVSLAQDVERDWGVRVDEIYGCTEGGMLATRRPAHDERFMPGPGLCFSLDAKGRPTVTGGQLEAPLFMADRFARDAGGEALRLLGRDAELVKIAGKRTTLGALNVALRSIAGVRDAAYVPPGPDDVRLAALVVAPGHDARSLRRALGALVDRAFLPRPLLFTAALPRDAQGKLPAAALRKALDAGLAAGEPGAATARPDRALARRCAVEADHPALPGHFPGRPVVPGVVLLERVERLLRDHGIVLQAVDEAKFTRPVAPGEPIAIRVDVSDGARARFGIDASQGTAASGTLKWRLA